MLTVVLIILTLCVAFCLGRNEIAYCYASIRIADMMKMMPFVGFLLVVMIATMGLVEPSAIVFPFGQQPLAYNYVIALVAMVLTMVVHTTIGRPFSAVTIFWGVLLAVGYTQVEQVEGQLWLMPLISVIAAPLLSAVLTLLVYKLISLLIAKENIHLLMKQLYIKWLAIIGVVLCGLALTYNYGLLIKSLLIPIYIDDAAHSWMHWVLAILVGITCMTAVGLFIRRKPRDGHTPKQMASLYAQTLVLPLFNIVLPLTTATLPPVLVSANLLKEGNALALNHGKESKYLNMLILSLFSPLLAFLIYVCMQSVYTHPYLFWALFFFIILACLLTKLSYRQFQKGRNVSRMLHDELKHRDEMSNELNRLDVMFVTSQFDSMSREIDFKHRELIDLSLYVQQQREYITDMGKKLSMLTKESDVKTIRKELAEIDKELKDTLRYPPEMEKIYQDVEKMHHDFISRLLMRCPSLSERERRLAILLRLGFSSKEIANIVSVEPKSVEINRYRLRKKLQLERGENLVTYLQLL